MPNVNMEGGSRAAMNPEAAREHIRLAKRQCEWSCMVAWEPADLAACVTNASVPYDHTHLAPRYLGCWKPLALAALQRSGQPTAEPPHRST